MKLSDFSYDLPEELIAQTPLSNRSASRLLVVDRHTGEYEDRHFEDVLDYSERKMRSFVINFPLYTDVCELYLGLEESAKVEAAPDYEIKVPVVYYGSSITQGGCASRPGTSYQAIISRRLNCDYVNLGFSGNAKGEPAIAEYIAGLEMSVFVYDYDHNAPNPEHLAADRKSTRLNSSHAT